MAARPYVRRPAALLTTAGAVGALLGWLARRGLRPSGATRPERGPRPSRVAWPSRLAGPGRGPSPSPGPSPFPGPVPVPERTVDARYTAEEPYTGRLRPGAAGERTQTDVPGGTPP